MSYSEFALYYDALIDDDYYESYLDFLNKHLTSGTILELGCGTAEKAIRLAFDHEVIATDISNEMLDIARDKALGENVSLAFYCLDMCDFTLATKVDHVLVLTDALNYLSSLDEVKRTFENAYEALKEDGLLIGDVNSMYKCNVILDDYQEEFSEDDFHFYWHVTTDHQGGITHDVKIDDGQEHIHEIHHQRTYPIETYVNLLKTCGFKEISLYTDFGDFKEKGERHIFVAKKGSK